MSEAKATFVGDADPLEKTMAQLRRAMKTNADAVKKDLTFKPTMNDTVMLAGMANIKAQLKQWASTPVKGPQIQFDLSKSSAYLDQVYGKLQGPESMMARSRGGVTGSGGGGSRANMGMAAMQVQDIAIQLQMGTQLSTIIAQQGSQMASILGPGGMIAGGALAVAGLLYNVGKAASDAFDKVITGARVASADIDKLAASGSVEQIAAGMDRIKAAADALPEMRKAMGSIGGVLSNSLGMYSGGRSRNEQIGDMLVAEGELNAARAKGDLSAVQASDQLLRIARLRADGREKEADAMERQAALANKIQSIQESNFGMGAKTMLIDNLKQQAALAEKKITADEASSANRKKQEEADRLTKSISERKRGLAFDGANSATGGDRLQMLEARAAGMRNDAMLNGYATTESGASAMARNGNLKGADSSLAWIKEYRDVMSEIESLQLSLRLEAAKTAKGNEAAATAKQREAQAFSDMVDDENASIANQQSVAATGRASQLTGQAGQLANMASNAAINNARVHGHNRKADRMESAAGMEEKKQALMAGGMKEADAAKAARGMQRDEDRLAGRRVTIGRAPAGSTRGHSPLDLLQQGAQQAGARAAAAAKDSQVSFKEAADMIATLKAIEAKLDIAN